VRIPQAEACGYRINRIGSLQYLPFNPKLFQASVKQKVGNPELL